MSSVRCFGKLSAPKQGQHEHAPAQEQPEAPSCSRIGILGGTFDPIHTGHLIMAEQAWERFGLDKVLFIPAADPPHKAGSVETDARHRYEMVRLAVQGNDHFELSRLEMDRPGPSYTVDTLARLRAELVRDVELYLLVGTDEARDLMTWREPYHIQELATIVVANRPGLCVDEVIGSLPRDFADKIVRLQMPGVDISSTDIRERIAAGRTIRYLTPDPAAAYIRDNGLYGGKR